MKEEGNETVTNCNQLKLLVEDGKKRLTDVAKVARTQLESKLGRSVVTQANAKKPLSENTKDRGKDELTY